MEHVVLHSRWRTTLSALATESIPVVLANGARDPVPVTGRSEQLARQHPTVTSVAHPTADHDLPLAEPAWCRLLLNDDLERR